ncbi:helix-turn-helix transcriptional regulator [Edwardsiella piscicida]|uniref:helix-turn-helix domain-containing protein n=1 Tax=Edwardsiella piscicida TaxID=1263550 RepID=UPI00370DCEAD
MSIIVRLDVLLAERKIKSKDLASAIGITEQNISILRQGKVKGIRFSTLEAICRYLNCQPGDLCQRRVKSDPLTSPPTV